MEITYQPDYFTIKFENGEIELNGIYLEPKHGRTIEDFKKYLKALKDGTSYTVKVLYEALQFMTDGKTAIVSSGNIDITFKPSVIIPAIEQLIEHHTK